MGSISRDDYRDYIDRVFASKASVGSKPSERKALHAMCLFAIDCFKWMAKGQRTASLYFDEMKCSIRRESDEIDFSFSDSPIAIQDFVASFTEI
jgi:hypothetical protein